MAATVSLRVDWRDIPRLIAADGKKTKRAAAKTLNSLAFDTIPTKNARTPNSMTAEAKRKLDFRNDDASRVRRALGFRVRKRARPDSLSVDVGSDRGWLKYHTEDGQRKSADGDWLLIPSSNYPKAWTLGSASKPSMLKSGFRRRSFIVRQPGRKLILYRGKRDRKVIYLGALVKRADHKDTIDEARVLRDVMKAKGSRLFRFYMDQQRR